MLRAACTTDACIDVLIPNVGGLEACRTRCKTCEGGRAEQQRNISISVHERSRSESKILPAAYNLGIIAGTKGQ